jgi:hypothetical protein
MNRDPWSITYRIVANKLKTGNIMFIIKKTDGSMTAGWQETANEIIKCLFLKDDEALEEDRLSTEEEDVVEVSEIKEYIHTLKANKAPSPDGIKTEIYQKTSDITAPFLIQIINDCFRKEYFPTQHKKAELSLIYKGGDKDPQDAKSYRPICLLNIQGKIIEKAIHAHLHSYLEQQEKPHSKQYGYKKGKSTVDAISHIVDKIKTRNTTCVLGLFVDFSGAFDRMSWPRLFSLLKDLHILPHVYNLLRSYFEGREVQIRTPECIARKKINRGCPQGSILGPILWYTYLEPAKP